MGIIRRNVRISVIVFTAALLQMPSNGTIARDNGGFQSRILRHSSVGVRDKARAEDPVPKLVKKAFVDGQDIAPFLVSEKSLSQFVETVRGEDFNAILECGKKLFRYYAKLHGSFKAQLADYKTDEKRGRIRYVFYKREANLIRLDLDSKSAMVSEFWSVDKHVHGVRVAPIDDATALSLFANYLERSAARVANYKISLALFGENTRVFSVWEKAFSNPAPSVYIMDGLGKIRVASLESWKLAHQDEYPSSGKKDVHQKLTRSFVGLHGRGRIVSRLDDIPGIRKRPLDKDLQPVIRSLWSQTDEKGNLFYVTYTYSQIGGVLRRYKFTFDKGTRFRDVNCIVLGRGVGDARYYE